MTYSPPADVIIPMVSVFGPWGTLTPSLYATAPASGAWGSTANDALFFPVYVPGPCVVRRVWWANGATVSASYNLDCGVYENAGHKPGAKLVSSGSTAQGTASQVQFVDVTDTALTPGWKWIALSCSNTSATLFRVVYPTSGSAFGFRQTSSVPLPTSATPVELTTGYVPAFGFATTASP